MQTDAESSFADSVTNYILQKRGSTMLEGPKPSQPLPIGSDFDLAFGVRYMVLGDRCIRGKMGFI